MLSEMQNDRITEDNDWRDGMDQFRLRMFQKIEELEDKIEQLNKERKNGSI